jgi:tetrahydromethanopterin S-methyltransferase subunit A
MSEDLHIDLQQSMNVLQIMIDTINNRTIEMSKEIFKLKYLMDLKKSKQITQNVKEMTEEDKKTYITKQKMYISKLNSNEIKNPKEDTLKYYNLTKEADIYIVKET